MAMATRTNWKCSGACVAGRSHESNRVGCQDAWSSVRRGSDAASILAACLCDGAGTAANSADGAAFVSRSLAGWISENFERAIAVPDEAVYEAMMVVKDHLRQRGANLATHACTVVAVAVGGDDDWLAWHLGDGGIIARFSGASRLLSAPAKGEFANITDFFSDSYSITKIRCYSPRLYPGLGSPDGFALFTDGLEPSIYTRSTVAVAPAVDKMLGWLESGSDAEVTEAVTWNLREVFRLKTGDDCGLVLLRKCEGGSDRPETVPHTDHRTDGTPKGDTRCPREDSVEAKEAQQ